MLRNDGTVIAVNVNVIPQYDIKEGLRLIGIITPLKKFAIFDQELNFDQVFTILANSSNKIIHVSENCHRLLKFDQSIST